MSGLFDPTTAGGLIFWIGMIIFLAAAVIGAALVGLRNVKFARSMIWPIIIGLVVVGVGLLVGFATPAPTASSAPSIPGATVNTVVNSANFVGGETWTPSTNTVVVSLVYNSTAGGVFVAPKVGFTGSGSNTGEACGSSTACHQYVVIPAKLARTDSINQTAGFTLQVNGIPTLTSTGSNPTVYAPIGYTAATSTSGGVWKIAWSAGSLSGISPSQNAPSVTSGVGANVVGVPAFGSYSTALSLTLGGGNTTAGVWGSLAQNYTTYTSTINVTGGSGSTPAFLTVQWILIGWTK